MGVAVQTERVPHYGLVRKMDTGNIVVNPYPMGNTRKLLKRASFTYRVGPAMYLALRYVHIGRYIESKEALARGIQRGGSRSGARRIVQRCIDAQLLAYDKTTRGSHGTSHKGILQLTPLGYKVLEMD